MNRRLTTVALAFGWMTWGTIVDMQGLPVLDQVTVALVLTIAAIMIKE
jgi:hypothetical protein